MPEKGQEFAVRAMAEVRAKFPPARLLLAGDGPCRGQLEKLARELGVADAVIFAGFVEDIAQVYRALDVFVFPSLAEPLGTSLLAAMGWGLPVVAVASGKFRPCAFASLRAMPESLAACAAEKKQL